jgi:hypothetical protein
MAPTLTVYWLLPSPPSNANPDQGRDQRASTSKRRGDERRVAEDYSYLLRTLTG